MKEIEILVEVYEEKDKVLEVLNKFEYVNEKEVIDIYYYDPMRDDLKPAKDNRIDQCFRLRKNKNSASIAYKVDHFDEKGRWKYSDEYETSIENTKQMEEIINKLGMKKLIEVVNTKKIYKYKEYEIAFETVENLGLFLEVEYCTSEDINIDKKKAEIQAFINDLNLKLSAELNMGKPEMMLNKIKTSIKGVVSPVSFYKKIDFFPDL